jgi:hypothetical protein
VSRAPADEVREVPITTLDALREEHGWTPPFGLKLDVEGYEDRVIAGATGVLEQTEFVISEISLTRRFDGAASSRELVELLREHGFRMADVLHAGPSPLGVHADALFVRD